MASMALCGGLTGRTDLSRASTYEHELSDLAMRAQPPSSPVCLPPAEQSSTSAESNAHTDSGALDLVLETIRELLPSHLCDRLRSVIEQVSTERVPIDTARSSHARESQ